MNDDVPIARRIVEIVFPVVRIFCCYWNFEITRSEIYISIYRYENIYEKRGILPPEALPLEILFIPPISTRQVRAFHSINQIRRSLISIFPISLLSVSIRPTSNLRFQARFISKSTKRNKHRKRFNPSGNPSPGRSATAIRDFYEKPRSLVFEAPGDEERNLRPPSPRVY